MELVEVADRLYAVPPGEFTRTRDAAVRQARQDGDRDLATALGSLRRPTKPAWVVNLLVRSRPAEVDELLGLGEALRQAQQRLAGEDLLVLLRQRHAAVAGLGRQALALARDEGEQVGGAVGQELEGTLLAALADPAAALAVRSGRLLRALSSVGFDPVDLTDAVALPAESSSAASAGQPTTCPIGEVGARAPEPTALERRRAARLAVAERDAAGAQRHAEEARRAQAAAEVAARAAQQGAEQAREAVRTAQEQLDAARREAADAETALQDAEAASAEAAERAAAARRGAEAAQERLTQLRGAPDGERSA